MKKITAPLKNLHYIIIAISIFALALAVYPKSTITVYGEAQLTSVNKSATFNAGVNSTKDTKEEAVNEVNSKIKNVIDSVKSWGVDTANIKTQNLSVYRTEQSVYEDGMQKTKPGQWSANNNVEIKLVNKTQKELEDFTNLLTSSEATNVNGPYFDTTKESAEVKQKLYEDAIKNADTKANNLVKNIGKNILRKINIYEGQANTNNPIMYTKDMGMGGGGAVIEPGTNTVSTTVTVVYEIW